MKIFFYRIDEKSAKPGTDFIIECTGENGEWQWLMKP